MASMRCYSRIHVLINHFRNPLRQIINPQWIWIFKGEAPTHQSLFEIQSRTIQVFRAPCCNSNLKSTSLLCNIVITCIIDVNKLKIVLKPLGPPTYYFDSKSQRIAFFRLCRVMQEHLMSLVAYGQHHTWLRAHQLEPTSNGAPPKT